MREKEWRRVFTFHTTTEAMAMEAACRDAGMPGRLIPVPRQISAGCGMAWICPLEEGGRLERFMEEKGLAREQTCDLCL